MTKTIAKLFVIAGIAFAGVAHATSPAETAGICAGNAMKLKEFAQAAKTPAIEAKALSQQNRLYAQYGKQKGFIEAGTYSYNQNLTVQARLNIGEGCLKEGF